jgi:hypothetical protein
MIHDTYLTMALNLYASTLHLSNDNIFDFSFLVYVLHQGNILLASFNLINFLVIPVMFL